MDIVDFEGSFLGRQTSSTGEKVLRAAGMDALLGFPPGRTADFISRQGLPSEKLTQPIENIVQKSHAKFEAGPVGGRYLTEDQAMTFIEELSAEVLKESERGAAARRETLQSKIGSPSSISGPGWIPARSAGIPNESPFLPCPGGAWTSRRRGRDVRERPGRLEIILALRTSNAKGANGSTTSPRIVPC